MRISEDMYERDERFDHFNSDLVKECARECERDHRCRAFNFRTRDDRCDLVGVTVGAHADTWFQPTTDGTIQAQELSAAQPAETTV